MDQIKALRVFATVADEGGLARAARQLQMSAPSVTRIINELENSLGVTLLHRTTRAVHATEVGENYLSEVRRILDDLDRASAAVRGERNNPAGTLRITASVLFGEYYVAPIVTDYLDQFGDVRVDALFVDRRVNIIEEGIDIAVRIGPLNSSRMRAAPVGEVRHVVCGSPAYLDKHGEPQSVSDLDKHKLIEFSGSDASTWGFADRRKSRIARRLTFSTLSACIETAKAGWGLVRALSYQVGPALASGELQEIPGFPGSESWPVNLVYVAERSRSAKVRAFLELAADRLRTDPRLAAGGT